MNRFPLRMTALICILAMTGCAGNRENAGEEAAGTTPSASALRPDLNRFTPPPPGYVDDHTGEKVTPIAVPTWDEKSRSSLLRAAEQAMTAFARPSLDYDTWWADLEPLLNEQAIQDYAFVDPANIPATTVTGPGVQVDDSSAYVGYVDVPTDAGVYQLILNRADADSPWLLSRVSPPETGN